jgi:hypothetical protein
MNNADILITLVLLESVLNWADASPDEHNEAVTQARDSKGKVPDHLHAQLTHLSSRDNFSKALSSSKTEFYNSSKFRKVNNTEAGIGGKRKLRRAIKGLNPVKLSRVRTQISDASVGRGSLERPVILRHKESGYEHLLSGNTRSSLATSLGHPVSAHVIEY